MRRVVVTGFGFVSPLGNTYEDLLKSLREGYCAVDEITAYNTHDMEVKLACEAGDFTPEKYLDKKSMRRMDKVNQMGIAAAVDAADHAGLTEAVIDKYNPGVYVSSGIGGIYTLANECKKGMERGFDKISPFFIPMSITNLTAANIAIRLGAKGSCQCNVTACAGATNSIGEAYRAIKHGYEDMILAGGAESSITALGVGGFTSMKALSVERDPKRASIPFDKERSGFVMGEGAGILVLETLDSALEREAHIYAEIGGYGTNCDAYHITSPSPEGAMAAKAMEYAMKEGNVKGEDVEYINAHGTSTPLNDKYETMAIKKALGAHGKTVPVSSSKSQMGHLLGASGAVESIITIIAMNEGFMPATINYREKDPECDLNLIVNEIKEQPFKTALKNSLGFGGHNATLLFKKWEV